MTLPTAGLPGAGNDTAAPDGAAEARKIAADGTSTTHDAIVAAARRDGIPPILVFFFEKYADGTSGGTEGGNSGAGGNGKCIVYVI
jgi:hypothetical protein